MAQEKTAPPPLPESMRIRRVKLSIKYKFLAVLGLVISATVIFYVIFALKLFRQDKSAYIFGTSLSTTEYLNAQVQAYLNAQKEQTILLRNQWLKNRNALEVEELMQTQDHLLDFEIYIRKKGSFSQVLKVSNRLLQESSKEKFLSIPPLGQKDIMNLLKNKVLIESIDRKEESFFNFIQISGDKLILLARVKTDHLERSLRKDNIYQSYILDSYGKLLAGEMTRKELEKRPYTQTILGLKDVQKASYYQNENGKEVLAAHSKNLLYHLTIISEIPVEKAFSVADLLINKSIYFGIFVISLGLIIALYFSRSLTRPIETLFNLTQKIARGDFSQRAKLGSKDEIGALSDSINYMSDEIVRYTEEMKEKVRLENEVAVANLVQSAFFPANQLKLPQLDNAAFHASASECGGDWWGHFSCGDKDVFLIIDATGHGVPAALLTATANSCKSNLELISQDDQSYLNSPAKILQFINHSVCDIGSDIMMTAIAMVFDHSTKELKYANASHNPAFHFQKAATGKVDKSHFIPLMVSPGPRIGEKKEASYQEEVVSFKSQDGIVLFTDGLLEGMDPEGKQWGQRKFLKSLVAHIENPANQVVESTIQDAHSFFKDRPYDDDITLVIVKVV